MLVIGDCGGRPHAGRATRVVSCSIELGDSGGGSGGVMAADDAVAMHLSYLCCCRTTDLSSGAFSSAC